MPAKKYRIELTTEEQQELKALVSKGRAAAYKQTHARILLLSDEARKDGGLTDEEVARSLEIASATVERIRRRCVEEGIEAALGRKEQQRRRPKKLDGAAEAHLIALACGEPPEGRARWTLRLLGGPAGGVRDSGEQSYARVRAGQRRLTGKFAPGCMLMVRRVVRTKAEWTLVDITRWGAWSGSLTAASLVTSQAGRSRSIDCSMLVTPSGVTSTQQSWRE